MTALPKFATDCHTHVFGPTEAFPLAADRAYTPKEASEADARQMLARLGLERIVFIHASVYDNNARLFQGLEVFGPAARAVVILSGQETDADLRRWNAMGVRGVRINNMSTTSHGPEAVAETVIAASRRVADLGWHVEVLLGGDDLRAVLTHASELAAPLVVGHFGHLPAHDEDGSGLHDLLADRLADGRCWLKLSASYRLPGAGRDAARHLTRRFLAANDEQLLWGSDWPHPPVNRAPEARLTPQPFRDADTKQLFDDFLAEAESPALRQRILVDNPARLYGF